MAVVEQFAGLEMAQLIGAPLAAAADAGIQLADAAADFISRVGLDESGKVRTAAFQYQRRRWNEDGTSNLDEMKVELPLLAIVPVPNLQVEEVSLLFDMEVKQSEKKDTALELSANTAANAGIGPAKVSITGNVSAHHTNTRGTDYSAKYHVDVRATNYGMPEGLSRVLDVMTAELCPTLVRSDIKDENGQELLEQEGRTAGYRKTLERKLHRLERQIVAAKKGRDGFIRRMKEIACMQQKLYDLARLQEVHSVDGIKESQDLHGLDQALEEADQSWSVFLEQAETIICLLADMTAYDENKISDLFLLKCCQGGKVKSYDSNEAYYPILLEAQNRAVRAQQRVNVLESEQLQTQEEYQMLLLTNHPLEENIQ